MHIGLDVDGVLVDTRTFQLREGKKYFRKFGLSAKKPDMFEVQDVFECSKEQREKFCRPNIFGDIVSGSLSLKMRQGL